MLLGRARTSLKARNNLTSPFSVLIIFQPKAHLQRPSEDHKGNGSILRNVTAEKGRNCQGRKKKSGEQLRCLYRPGTKRWAVNNPSSWRPSSASKCKQGTAKHQWTTLHTHTFNTYASSCQCNSQENIEMSSCTYAHKTDTQTHKHTHTLNIYIYVCMYM